jgi:uncharacterized membrane protein YwzB
MNQSRLESLIETLINTAIGFAVSYAAWPLVAVMFDMHYSAGQHLGITLVFTVISVARGYVVRRWFNAGLHRAAVRLAKRFDHYHHGIT